MNPKITIATTILKRWGATSSEIANIIPKNGIQVDERCAPNKLNKLNKLL